MALVLTSTTDRTGRAPSKVADPVAFLASPSASYLTGQLLVVDGGRSIQEGINRHYLRDPAGNV
jgi:3-oxoacyl-[acyl-carrier protein] reductase